MLRIVDENEEVSTCDEIVCPDCSTPAKKYESGLLRCEPCQQWLRGYVPAPAPGREDPAPGFEVGQSGGTFGPRWAYWLTVVTYFRLRSVDNVHTRTEAVAATWKIYDELLGAPGKDP
ncbi:MAG: hypothetical protein K0U16_07600 [Gammaproteobacteria bacterium]|nr:hypothetical protein [Gammaproteobacteria bacterium]